MRILLLIISLLVIQLLYSQVYNFQYLSQTNGLTNTFVNDIVQDSRGFLFIGTGEGIGIYNGQEVSMYTKADGITDNYITKCLKDKNGNIWFGHIQGGSSVYFDRKFGKVHVGAGIDSQINDIAEDNEGRIWFVAQNYGLYFYTEDNQKDFFPKISGNKQYYSLFITENNHFLVGTDEGIEVFNFSHESDNSNILSKSQQVDKMPDVQIVSIVNFQEKILAFSNSGQIYEIIYQNNYYSAQEIYFANNNQQLLITDVNTSNNSLLLSTFQQGLLNCYFLNGKIFIQEKFNKKSGLKTDAVKTSFVDREGVLWIGTYGEGLSSKEDDIFTYYYTEPKSTYPIYSIAINDTRVVVATDSSVRFYDKQHSKIISRFGIQNGLPRDQISCLAFTKDSTLIVGTLLNGIYKKANNSDKFEPIIISNDNLSNTISDIEIFENYLFIGTLNGAYRYDFNTGGITVYNITTGLPHNSIGALYTTSKGELFVGTNSAFISKIIDKDIINYPIYDGLQVVEVNDIHEDNKGNVWFCSNGNGIFQLKEGKCRNITTLNGLMSNYCNSLRVLSDKRIWVAHHEGLTKWNDVEQIALTYDDYYGLTNRFLRSSANLYKNELWLGTENGLVLYDEYKDSLNTVPPITSLKYLNINDSIYNFDQDIYLPYGSYKFGFGLAGLTLKGSKKVMFEFILEGYDTQWSKKTDKNSIYYTGMYDGEYIFRVKSYNADGTEGNEIKVRIVVEKPYWKKWWFYLICLTTIAATFYSVIKYRERSFIKYQEKLKHDLALRTREVVEQKNKIEEINKDLTDSINYAQRIQRAILPANDYFNELFPKSFVLFQPRDIVSGDFYWCAEVNKKKILICADCTGHGVPGGFMSMISHILITESLDEASLTNPALILQKVNDNIVQVLKQTDDLESNRDGLDVAIIIIDEENKEVKFAGAMRPLYIYRNGVRNIVKGDRYSLGGMMAEKIFESKSIEIQTGDKLYIFTDGYADQFGGPRRTKMKLKVFQEYLDQISQQSMSEQKISLDNFFYEWKGEFTQMDDILVMGIEI
ncbi:MAG: SpoIIE family protein phosphatase [Flavobacteriales bacterium]|nr:SpoIIE family protein phosphatase [Flavobacteriales bacterium]